MDLLDLLISSLDLIEEVTYKLLLITLDEDITLSPTRDHRTTTMIIPTCYHDFTNVFNEAYALTLLEH